MSGNHFDDYEAAAEDASIDQSRIDEGLNCSFVQLGESALAVVDMMARNGFIEVKCDSEDWRLAIKEILRVHFTLDAKKGAAEGLKMDIDSNVNGMTAFAGDYFRDNLMPKIHLALAELIGESIWYAAPKFAEQLGANKRSINLFKPTFEDLDSTVGRIGTPSRRPLLRGQIGANPTVEVSNQDCIDYLRRYEALLPVVREARRQARKKSLDNLGCVGLKKQFRQLSHLPDALIAELSSKEAARVCRKFAAYMTDFAGFSDRKLADLLGQGRKLIAG